MHLPSHTISQNSHSPSRNGNMFRSICDTILSLLPHTKKEQKRQSNILLCKRYAVYDSIAKNGRISKERTQDFLEHKDKWYEEIRGALHTFLENRYESLLKELKNTPRTSWEDLPEKDKKILARGFQSPHLDLQRIFLYTIPEFTIFAQIHSAEDIFEYFLANIHMEGEEDTHTPEQTLSQ